MNERPIISFRIKREVKEGMQKLAQEDRRTLSSYIEIVLEDHVAAKKPRPKQRG